MPTGYEWYGASDGTNMCIMCHEDVTANVAATTGQTHVAHAGSAALYGIANIGCASCHANGPAWGGPGTAPSAGHMDGSFTFGGAIDVHVRAGVPDVRLVRCERVPQRRERGGEPAGGEPVQLGFDAGVGLRAVPPGDADGVEPHGPPELGVGPGVREQLRGVPRVEHEQHVDGGAAQAHRRVGAVRERGDHGVGGRGAGAGVPASPPTGASTDRCNHCHSTAVVNGVAGVVLAKSNWNTGAYTLPCLSCHNGMDAATNFADGTGRAAPNTLGDDTTYGAEVKGHNLPGGSNYLDVDGVPTGNAGAGRACTDCHSATVTHLNNADDTTYAGDRLLATINAVATGSTTTGACRACHANGLGTQVSTHGNVNAAFTGTSTHDTTVAAFGYLCDACHDVHGMTYNGTDANIFMIRPAVGVGASYTTTPGGAGATTAAVRFVRMTGTDSFDDGATQTNNMCVVCHVNAGRPDPDAMQNPNGDGTHTNNVDYTGNEQGKSCIGCHSHEYDANAGTVDGFMPLQCNGCHSYPGLSALAPANQHRLSAIHDEHVGRPSNEAAVNNKGYACSVCHSGSQHNNAAIASGLQWGTVTAAHIQVRFDPAWNPATGPLPADAGAGDSSSWASPNCNNLYCHGATLGAGGTLPSPSWTGPAFATCVECHQTTGGTGGLNSRSHGPHLTTLTGAGGVCNDCHTAYDLSSVGTHMNGQVTFVGGADVHGGDDGPGPDGGLWRLRDEPVPQQRAALGAARAGVRVEHGDRGDQQLHGVPQLDADDAGDQQPRAAPDDADGGGRGVRGLPRGGAGDGEHARGRDGAVQRGRGRGELHVRGGGGRGGGGGRRELWRLRDEPVPQQRAAFGADRAGVRLEHGDRGDQQLHGVPQLDADDAGDQQPRAAPDDADGGGRGVRGLPRGGSGDGEHARGRDGAVQRGRGCGELHVRGGGQRGGGGRRRELWRLRDEPVPQQRAAFGADRAGVRLEHGDRGDQHVHGVPQLDADDAGDQQPRAAPDDADGSGRGVRGLPRGGSGDGEHARGRDGAVQRGRRER